MAKCPICKNNRIIDCYWFRDITTNLDTWAYYCRSCYYLCSIVGSLNPFKGFKKHSATSDKKMINFSKSELETMELPEHIYDAIIEDKKNKGGL